MSGQSNERAPNQGGFRWALGVVAVAASLAATRCGGDGGNPSGVPASDLVGVASYTPPTWDPSDPVRLIILGDSISAGMGATTTDLDYPSLLVHNDDATWPDMAGFDLDTLTGGDIEIIDAAVSGAVTQDVLDEQLPGLEDQTPMTGRTIVVMTIGGNDLTAFLASGSPADIVNHAGDEIDRIAGNVGQVADWFNDQRFPDGVSLVVANVYDPTDNTAAGGVGGVTCFDLGGFAPILTSDLELARSTYESTARAKGFAVADGYGYFLGHGYDFANTANPNYRPDDPTGWFHDCVHPNDRGHHELRRLMYALLDPSFRL